MQLRLGGPAWYWLDHDADGFQVRQIVTLDVETLLTGEFGLESKAGIASLHFRPTAPPVIDVRVTNDVDVEPQTFWATVVDALPFAFVPAKAKRQLSSQVASRFEERLDEGATFTVDLRSGDTDMALGHLAAGETPRHPFHDGRSALVNERQLLHPGSAHVVGPFEATRKASLDVLVEQGEGVAYQVACASDVERSLGEGAVLEVDAGRSPALGRIQGAGLHHASVTADSCEWCLVTTSSGTVPSVVALRVRPGTSD